MTTITATDPDAGAMLTYSIIGRADQARFQLHSMMGTLSFVTSPDFEDPTDTDHNNSYVVRVRASDGTLFDDQTLTINVFDATISDGGPGAEF